MAGGLYARINLQAKALMVSTWFVQWYRTEIYQVFGVDVQQRKDTGHDQKSDAQKRVTKQAAKREQKREGHAVGKRE